VADAVYDDDDDDDLAMMVTVMTPTNEVAKENGCTLIT